MACSGFQLVGQEKGRWGRGHRLPPSRGLLTVLTAPPHAGAFLLCFLPQSAVGGGGGWAEGHTSLARLGSLLLPLVSQAVVGSRCVPLHGRPAHPQGRLEFSAVGVMGLGGEAAGMGKTCFHANVKSSFKNPNSLGEEYRKSGGRTGCLCCAPPGDGPVQGFVSQTPAASMAKQAGPLRAHASRALSKVSSC